VSRLSRAQRGRSGRLPGAVRAVATIAVLLAVVGGTTACVGSGKTAHADEIGALPSGYSVVYESTAGCRDGESGFDYRFLVIEGEADLTSNGPFLSTMRANGFTWSNSFLDRLPWTTVTYAHVVNPDGTQYALGLEIGVLSRYLTDPVARTGPDPAALPADARAHPGDYLLVAMRPTDFLCSTPL